MSNKIYFKPGDVVAFKGLDLQSQPLLRVDRIVFKSDENNKLIRSSDGSKILEGVVVQWFSNTELPDGTIIKHVLHEKIVSSKDIFIVKYPISYYLCEAKKVMLEKGATSLIVKINELIQQV